MPAVPDTPAASADARPPLSTRGLKPFDLNPDEMDDVTMRIFNELRKQLSMMENKKAEQLDAQDRERHARILASLERTMERLAKVEAGRAAARKSVKEQNDGSALEAIERRVAGAVAAEFARSRAEGAHGG
jgi:TolA-binding protein